MEELCSFALKEHLVECAELDISEPFGNVLIAGMVRTSTRLECQGKVCIVVSFMLAYENKRSKRDIVCRSRD